MSNQYEEFTKEKEALFNIKRQEAIELLNKRFEELKSEHDSFTAKSKEDLDDYFRIEEMKDRENMSDYDIKKMDTIINLEEKIEKYVSEHEEFKKKNREDLEKFFANENNSEETDNNETIKVKYVKDDSKKINKLKKNYGKFKKRRLVAKNISVALAAALLTLGVTVTAASLVGENQIKKDTKKLIKNEFLVEKEDTKIVISKIGDDINGNPLYIRYEDNKDALIDIIKVLKEKGMSNEEVYVALKTMAPINLSFINDINVVKKEYLNNVKPIESFNAKIAYTLTRSSKEYNK